MALFNFFLIAYKSFNIHTKFGGDGAFLPLFTSAYKSKSTLKPPKYLFLSRIIQTVAIFSKYSAESITLNRVLLKGAKNVSNISV